MKRLFGILSVVIASVLLSCSIAAAAYYTVGDITMDDDVDVNDAILLLQYSMFPDLFTIDYPGEVDFSGDGTVDVNDAILLLQHSMFPDLFPLEDNTILEDPERATEDAYVLAHNVGMAGSKEGISSGWVLDNRGGPARITNSGFGTLGDISEKYATAYIREFNLVETGRLVSELEISTQDDGAFIEFTDSSEESTFVIKIIDGDWCVLDSKGDYSALDSVSGKSIFRIVTDLNKGVGEIYINEIYYGGFELLSDDILSLKIGIDEEGTGTLSISKVNIVVNYSVNESFDLFGIDDVYGWKSSGDVYVYNEELYVESASNIRKNFTPIEGTFSFETYFNTIYGKDFSIKLGNVLTLKSEDLEFSAGDKHLYTLTPDMWYRLRVDADTDKGTAKIWLNGRVLRSVNLSRKQPVANIVIKADDTLIVDDIKLYGTVEHEDYCPVPENGANLNDYIVAVNICSLWRNGTHYGWACITPYDEPSPILGYYDEGVPEMADWEIKYMVEHGIDVQAFCWYGDVSNGPIKKPYLGEQLHDGYMYAKYSNYMKYVIQWETSASKGATSSQFRNYVVPYWFENYFLDERYLKLNNKIVIPIYNLQNLTKTNYFNDNDGVVEEINYLDAMAVEYGFDGVIILASGTPSEQLENLYVDGTYAYSWGESGNSAKVNKDRITSAYRASETVYAIPTVSVGFDSIPWLHLRYGLMTKEDYKSVLEWVRDTHIPSAEKPEWAEKLVWLSTWNEYGEGTYISPGGQNGDGFGYVDMVREVLTNLPAKHKDVVPTKKQLERITHMYPQYARLLRREGWYTYESDLTTSQKEPKNKLFINDVDILANTTEEFHLPPVIKNGKVYFPFNPSTAVNYILGCHYEWRRDAGTLRILANGHEVKFRVGSARYTLDGAWKDLAHTFETFDGVPLIDFVLLANDLEYDVEESDGNVYIFTDTYEEVWVPFHNRPTGSWEFNDCDTEGWDSTHFDMTVGGGTMLMKTNGNNDSDPVSYFSGKTKDFYTKRFTDFEMRVKYNFSGSRQTFVLYYITDVDSSWNETKTIKFTLRNKNAWMTYKMNLADLIPWQSAERITGFRLDPFNCAGTFEIDYMRFIEDPDFEYTPPEEKEFEIINGDAENPDIIRFYSDNTKITIEEDPDNEENHVYLVNPNEGNTYAYIRYAAEYVPGATYKIDYDLRLVSSRSEDPDNAATSIACNLRYRDKNASGGIEHVIKQINLDVEDGWVHVSATHTVASIDSNSGAEFTIFANPQNGEGFKYMVDNVSIVRIS